MLGRCCLAHGTVGSVPQLEQWSPLWNVRLCDVAKGSSMNPLLVSDDGSSVGHMSSDVLSLVLSTSPVSARFADSGGLIHGVESPWQL